ncbi:hypothetical protein DSL72_006881 [Monilinia vaccinii-corymbosi]|uniref:BTB domain-containing protein n=1 Tax=Monilinia vaccinii-corymbosi TaxID=61207 RepID=A0A8A3PLB4_9HELO|nr:hypothetical protein DSL72_006881 [Monilinia vaccinii-corymbosi]
MDFDGLMPAFETLVEAATSDSGTPQSSHPHHRNHTHGDYIQKPGSHLTAEELGSIILRVEVGSSKEPGGAVTFRVHHKLLCSKVAIFQQYFGKNFHQAFDPDTQLLPDVELINDDPRAFKLLVGWLYMDTIDGDFDMDSRSASKLPRMVSFGGLLKSIKLPIYIKLCLFAELYEITRLENEAINFLIKFMIDTQTRPNPSCWLEVYRRTRSTSALRVLFSRIAAWQLSQGGLDGAGAMDLESILCRNEELRRDISTLRRDRGGARPADPFLAPPCDYHNHGPVEKCPYPRG